MAVARVKVLTLTQPWATLVAIGAKRLETRSWRTSYRGPLAIHAAKGPDKTGAVVQTPFFSTLKAVDLDPMDLPHGAIVAVCELRDVRIIGVPPSGIPEILADDNLSFVPILGREHAFGNYAAGRYAWLLANVRALATPVPAKGALGLWEYEGDLGL